MLNLKLNSEMADEYRHIESTLADYGQHLLWCINTPIIDLKGDYLSSLAKVPKIGKRDVSELILSNGLYNEWRIDVYGVKLGYELMESLPEMWLESVMREYYYRYGSFANEKGIAPTLKELSSNVAAVYSLNTVGFIPMKNINRLLGRKRVIEDRALRSARNAAAVGVLFVPGVGLFAAILSMVGVSHLTKMISVISLLDKSRSANFDPSKSVYETWGQGETMVENAASVISQNMDNPEFKDAVNTITSDMSEDERTEFQKNLGSVAEMHKQTAATSNETNSIEHNTSNPPSESYQLRPLISAEVERDDLKVNNL